MPGISMTPGMPTLICGALVVSGVSLADDRWRLPILVRFGAHGAGALIILAGGGYLHEVGLPGGALLSLESWGLMMMFIWSVGLTNAYNFMDGIDGLAAGQAVIAAMTMAWLALLRGADVVVWAGVVLAPFLFDTSATLSRRIVRGQRWYEARREHFYQRLIRRGWSHLAVTSLYLGITAFLGIATIAYYGYHKIASLAYVGLVILPLFGIVLLVRIVEARHALIAPS